MKLKALAAAAALGIAGNASAAIFDGNASSFGSYNPANADAELFLSVIDRGATPRSYTLDLGISTDAWMAGDTSGFVGNYTDAGLQSFIASATGTISWHVAGILNNLQTDTTDNGLFTTSLNTITSANAPQGFAGLSSGAQRLASYTTAVNQAGGTTDVAQNIGVLVSDPASTAFHDGPNWGSTWTGGSFGSTEAGLDQVMSFFYMSRDSYVAPTGINTLVTTFGQWNLDSTGVLSYSVSAVPVPAAAWLFGSGLVGLVGVARRRKTA